MLDAGSIDFAAGLILEIAVAADVVGVGVGVVDGCEVPVVCFEKAEYFFSGIFVVSAVDEADVFGVKLYQADAGWALDIVALIGYLYSFVHLKGPFFLGIF